MAENPVDLPDLELEIAKITSNVRITRQRAIVLASILGPLVMLAGVYSYRNGPFTKDESVLLVLIGICISAAIIGVAAITIIGLNGKLDELRTRRDVLSHFGQTTSRSSGGTEPSYFDKLVQINIENLAAYYRLVKVHTDKSFLVSLCVGVVGFLLIICGLLFGFGNSKDLAYISSGSGVLTEFIASVFFYLYNRTVQQMKGYHDSLLAVQNILLSFKLVGDTRDESEKVKMVTQMLAYLVGRRPDLTEEPRPSLAKAAAVGK
jgi:hypothetical protein